MEVLDEKEIGEQVRMSVENHIDDALKIVAEKFDSKDPKLVLTVANLFAIENQTVVFRDDLAGIAERLNKIGRFLDDIKASR